MRAMDMPFCNSVEEDNQSEGEDGDIEDGTSMSSPDFEEMIPFVRSKPGKGGGRSEKSYTVPQNRQQILSSYGSDSDPQSKCELLPNLMESQNSSHHHHPSDSNHHHGSTEPPHKFRRANGHGHGQPQGSAGGVSCKAMNGNGTSRKSLNPMVIVGLTDDEHYSSSSPFHSATEDFGGENDADRDRDPLIKPPSKTGGFHQLLSSKFKKQSASSDPQSSADSRVLNKGDETRRCSLGIFLAAISCIFFATSALIVKVSKLHPMQLLCVRGLVQGILVTPIVISSQSALAPNGFKTLLLSRAIIGSFALVMSFASIHMIPLADAATVIFTSPVFVSIFACICLGELCSLFDVAMIALTLIGVLLVSKPSFDFISTGSLASIGGTFCGLAAAMLTALAFIVLRQLKNVHYSVTVFWFSSVLALCGAVLTLALGGFTLPNDLRSISESIGIGICGFFGQILLTKALQIENAGPVAVARTMDIVLAFFYQITLLHDTPDWKSYLGSILVVSCVLLTAFRRWYRERSHADKTPSPSTSTSQLSPDRS